MLQASLTFFFKCVCLPVWQLAVTKIPNLDAGFRAPLPFLKKLKTVVAHREATIRPFSLQEWWHGDNNAEKR